MLAEILPLTFTGRPIKKAPEIPGPFLCNMPKDVLQRGFRSTLCLQAAWSAIIGQIIEHLGVERLLMIIHQRSVEVVGTLKRQILR
jgi:hypothetical protein